MCCRFFFNGKGHIKVPQECHGFTLAKGWGQCKQGWVVANSPCQRDQSNHPPDTNTQYCWRGVAGCSWGLLWHYLATENLCSKGWGQKQPRAPQVFPKLQSQNTSGLVTQVNAQEVAALFPQDSSSPRQGEAPSNSVLLQKSHISGSALNTKFLTLAGDAKWLTGVVIWGLQWCLLRLKHSCYRAQGWGWGNSAAAFDENRSHGSDEHIGVRARIWHYLLTRMTWLFNWILWWLCSSALKKTSCLIPQQSNARAIALHLQRTALGFTVLSYSACTAPAFDRPLTAA